MKRNKGKDNLIVALDVDGERRALELVDALRGEVEIFKVGSELFTSSGPGIVKKIKAKGGEVFLDLKFHDIPNTAAKASIAATRLGVFMFNIHALGGAQMMREAAEAVKKESENLNIAKPKLIGVTILTSMDEELLHKVGIGGTIDERVAALARSARAAGLDGIIASPAEIKLLRKTIGKDFLIVTPGVRPSWASTNDQKRVATPEEAIRNGADYIVIGRPIIEAEDPRDAVRKILEEI